MTADKVVLNADEQFYKWIVQKLSANKAGFAERLSKTTIQKITKEHICKGVGLTSKILRIVIQFNDGTNDKVIVKTPDHEGINRINTRFKTNPAEQKDYTTLVYRMIDRETQFFSLFGNCKTLKIPEIYAVEVVKGDLCSGGTIMMEDLSEKSALQSILKPFTKNQVLSLVEQFISCAALSLQSNPGLEKKFSKDSDLIETFFTIVRQGLKKMKTDKPGRFDAEIEKIEALLKMPEFHTYLLKDLNKELGIPAVLAHSDIHPRNMLWELDSDGNISENLYALIDWQRARFDDVGQDLAAALVICTTVEVRHEMEQWIFDYFCKGLQKLLQKTKQTIPFTAENVKKSYERSFVRHTLLLPSIRTILFDDNELKASDDEFCCRLTAAYKDSFEILKHCFPPFNTV